MLQNSVGSTTSSSIVGTRQLAGCPRRTRLPITPKVVPIVPVTPIVPIGPAIAIGIIAAPRAVAPASPPPISPGQLTISGARVGSCAVGFSHGGDSFADGGQPFRQSILMRGQRLRCRRMLVGNTRRRRAEQQRHADRAGGKHAGQDPDVFLPQRHETPPLIKHRLSECATYPEAFIARHVASGQTQVRANSSPGKLKRRSPIVPPIVPAAIVPTIAPIAPTAVSPSAVAPPMTPGELLLGGPRIDGVCRNIGNRLANGGQPFANSGGVHSLRLQSR